MRIPDESLDDFNFATMKPAEPPAPRSVRPTGTFEVLKPLARGEAPAKRAAAFAAVRPAPHRLSWFHRSLAMGGAVAAAALILVIGIQIWISGPPAEQVGPGDVAIDHQDDSMPAAAAEPFAADLLPNARSTSSFFDGPAALRSVTKRRPVRPRHPRTAYRPRRTLPPPHRSPLPPQFLVSEFVPTTLIIYVENGEIKTRLEPWLTAGYKKQSTHSN